MNIDKKTSLAYMCSACGEYQLFSLNAFMFSGSRTQGLACSCGGSRLEITKNSTKTFKLDIFCPVCKEQHSFSVPQNQFWGKGPFIYSCPFYEANILFIGEEALVERSVSEYIEQELDMMRADCPLPEALDFVLNAGKGIHMLEMEKEHFQICDCENPELTVAYNDKEIYLICKSCLHCHPIPFSQLDSFLENRRDGHHTEE